MLGSNIKWKNEGIENNSLLIGTPSSNKIIAGLDIKELAQINTDGFIISSQNIKGANCTIITANTDLGILYGVFNFIRLLQTAQNIASLNIVSFPKIKFRMLNHWDNLNRTVERGYAGFSIWDWHKLPDYIDKRYVDYARANASIGINGTLVNNVNGNATILTKQFLEKLESNILEVKKNKDKEMEYQQDLNKFNEQIKTLDKKISHAKIRCRLEYNNTPELLIEELLI